MTPLVQGWRNGLLSFAVLPDGSKLGWDASEEAAARRAELMDYIERYPAFLCEYVEVAFGGDGRAGEIVRESYETDEADGADYEPVGE